MKRILLIFVAFAVLLAACQPAPAEIAQAQEPEYEYSGNAEMVTVRFYYHSAEIDPNRYALPEAFLYNPVDIPAQNLREEFIRLMYEHIGVRIQDFWLEGDKLYVDLHEDSGLFFDQHGTTGGVIIARRFESTLLSLPETIASFEVLVDGQHGVEGNHFNFGHVAIVENGEVVRREFFDVLEQAPDSPVINTWQEAYASLLRYYAELPIEQFGLPVNLEWGWHFVLHDIDQNGIPELFVLMHNLSGHTNYHAIYAFSNSEAISLEFDNMRWGDLSILAPLDNSPWIILSHAVGSGASLTRLKIDGNIIVSDAQGLYHLSDEGFERLDAGYSYASYEWYVLSIDGNPVTVEEFESVFGGFGTKEPLEFFEITEANIQNIIFG